jgi:uncharacterized membrane protein YdbT with pleckstrin-like domain
MGYVDSNLMPDERLYARGRLHWIIFMKALLWTVAGLAALLYALTEQASGQGGGNAEPAAYAGLAFLVPALWNGVGALIERHSTELAVTSKRVIAKFGFIRRSTVELNHSKVESFHVEQGVLGRLLGYGTLRISGTGGGITPIPNISDPLGFRRRAMEAIDDAQR